MIRRAQVDVLDADETPALEAAPVVDATYSEEDSDAAAFSVTVPDRAGTFTAGQLVRVRLNGTPDFTGRVDVADRVIKGLTPDKQLFTLRGRDWLSEFEDAPISPPLGIGNLPAARIVRFDWTHPLLPRGDWVTPTYLGSLFTADFDPFGDPVPGPVGAKTGYDPEAWPDVFTGWIWSSPVDEFGSHADGDVSYFYLPITCAAGPLVPIFTADDTGALAIDNVELDSGVAPPGVQWTQAYAAGVPEVTAGVHHVCVRAENTEFDNQNGLGNPGAIATVIYQQLESTYLEFNNVIARTGLNVDSGDPLLGGDWKCLVNPAEPPGFTWGHAYRLLFDQAQAEGHLVGWSLGFTDDEDSNGEPWDVSPEITATVNDTHLAFLRQSHARGFCDFAARPGERVLDAWRWRERGDFWTGPAEPPVWDDGQLTQASGSQRR